MEHVDTVANHAFGFWLYLMTDLILFSTLFATFAVLRGSYAGGPTGKVFDLYHVMGETALLLISSASIGLVMLALYNGKKRAVLAGLAATFLLGFGFIFM
ncbi:MAG: cytochrome o ubiquinol oxidase subunit III, partial [Deltaproteobacteria bacterium]